MSLLDAWIVHCADPLGSQSPPPSRELAPRFADHLVDQAEAHGVLGALLKNFSGFEQDPGFAAARESARSRNRANAAFSALLARETDALLPDLKTVGAIVVKGATFARNLYPTPSLRSFSDIDILAPDRALSRLAEILSDRGFYLAESHKREFKWLSRANDRVMVEVQTDLVHPDSLHNAISLSCETIASSPYSPAAFLIVALVHGVGHQYERLQHVVDIRQAARNLPPADESAFEGLVQATNARLAAVSGLLLAGRLFDDARCRGIARGIGSTKLRELANFLVDRTVIMSTTDRRRAIFNWRRLVFRILLRHNVP
ncbi:nucleotidyltransferase family protein [Bradyrhizobium sp.]|uniref:nucleotidyltransferase family protein n=1 Tax=Bradyrhizobium sp. TaxID=376 RepID=UPI001D42FBDB|nr:nucleotidyltransferase family protein [Bradyrhizobium sp.]MBI5321076.1 nucleotidyltransferase family protein [Bradyrhizobium sp.]